METPTPTPKHGMSPTLITLIVSILTAIIVYLTSSCSNIPSDLQTPFVKCPLGTLCPNTDHENTVTPNAK